MRGSQPIKLQQNSKKLEDDLRTWIDARYHALEIAARLHHRLVWIHPFRNGNGRWARLAANIFLRQNDSALVVWPEMKLASKTRIREHYIDALRKADKGDLRPLTKIHQEHQT
jgi:Fic family protein